MIKPPLPKYEKERLCAVQGLKILQTPSEKEFDAFTKEAVDTLKVPISTITIIDSDKEWYKSVQGVETREHDRSISMCAHALVAGELMVVEDTLKDSRFFDNPLVTGQEQIRFYAGIALFDHKSGMPIGVFCIKDLIPRNLSVKDVGIFLDIADRVEAELNKRYSC